MELHVAEMRKLCEQFSDRTVVLALLQSLRTLKKSTRAAIEKGVEPSRAQVNLEKVQNSWNKRILLHKDFHDMPHFEQLVELANNDDDPPSPELLGNFAFILDWRKRFSATLGKYINKWLRGAILSLYCACEVASTQFSSYEPHHHEETTFLADSEIRAYKSLLAGKGQVLQGLMQIRLSELELLLKYAAVFPSNDPRNCLDLSKLPPEDSLPSLAEAFQYLRSVFQPPFYAVSEKRTRHPPNHFAGAQGSRSTSGSKKKPADVGGKVKQSKLERLVREQENPYNFERTPDDHYAIPAPKTSSTSSSNNSPLLPPVDASTLPSAVSLDELLAFKLQLLNATEFTQASNALSLSGNLPVQEMFKVALTYDHLACLRGTTWLNDEIMNFMVNLLTVRETALCEQGEGLKRNLFMNTFFMTKLYGGNEYNFAEVVRWTKRHTVFDYQRVFIPINTDKVHWHLVLVDMVKKLVLFYDSMISLSEGNSAPLYLGLTMKWLEDLWMKEKKVPKGDFPLKLWSTGVASCPQQENGHDCGVYVLAFMDFLSDGLSTSHVDPQLITHYRYKICSYILNGVIVDPRLDTIMSISSRTKSLLPANEESDEEVLCERMHGSSIFFELTDARPVKAARIGAAGDLSNADAEDERGKMAGVLALIGAEVNPQDDILAHPSMRAIVQYLDSLGTTNTYSTSKKQKHKKNVRGAGGGKQCAAG